MRGQVRWQWRWGDVALAGAAIVGALVVGGLVLGLVFRRELGLDNKNLLSVDSSDRIERFELRDASNTLLWRIVAPEGRAVPRLEYGRLPDGFVQDFPPQNGAPSLPREGESVTSETLTQRDLVLHQCVVVGVREFRCGRWEATPRVKLRP